MKVQAIKRLIRRLYCKHQSFVWLRENAVKPKGGICPVRCCLDCGKLTWAIMTPPGQYTFLHPVKMSGSDIQPPKASKVETGGFAP